eukprot:15480807-Alexandrium_andersonii.AAC.1
MQIRTPEASRKAWCFPRAALKPGCVTVRRFPTTERYVWPFERAGTAASSGWGWGLCTKNKNAGFTNQKRTHPIYML